jgi:hypothetical protein
VLARAAHTTLERSLRCHSPRSLWTSSVLLLLNFNCVRKVRLSFFGSLAEALHGANKELGLHASDSEHSELICSANYLNAQDVLLPPLPDLSRRLKIRLPEAQALVSAICRAITPRTSVVSTLPVGTGAYDGAGAVSRPGKRKRRNGYGAEHESESWIRTGDEGLDTLLGGGIRIGCITEIVGER